MKLCLYLLIVVFGSEVGLVKSILTRELLYFIYHIIPFIKYVYENVLGMERDDKKERYSLYVVSQRWK